MPCNGGGGELPSGGAGQLPRCSDFSLTAREGPHDPFATTARLARGHDCSRPQSSPSSGPLAVPPWLALCSHVASPVRFCIQISLFLSGHQARRVSGLAQSKGPFSFASPFRPPAAAHQEAGGAGSEDGGGLGVSRACRLRTSTPSAAEESTEGRARTGSAEEFPGGEGWKPWSSAQPRTAGSRTKTTSSPRASSDTALVRGSVSSA